MGVVVVVVVVRESDECKQRLVAGLVLEHSVPKTTLNNCVNHSVYIFKKYHLPDYEMNVLTIEHF